jgi:20S proteasome alpha/beta subunit
MGSLLQNSLSISSGSNDDGASAKYQLASIDDQDLKGRYYFDKFQITPFDEEKHLALRKAYVEGLVWNLKYYYEGCVSWEWYYPYHYGPMLSDLVNLDELLQQINFDDKLGAPLKPFEQLLGCMPPSQARHLPKPYRWLMTSPDSPIIDFYPKSFIVDMNGKRWPWEAVVLLPFIESKRLLEAVSLIDTNLLTDEERQRNATGEPVVLRHDGKEVETVPGFGNLKCFQTIDTCSVQVTTFDSSEWAYKKDKPAVLKPSVPPGTTYPLPGFSTLRIAPVQSLRRKKLGINVFGSKSRYRTSCLEIATVMPPLPPIEMVAPKLIGTTVVLNYPFCLEGLVTAVSNEKVTIRGQQEPRLWTDEEANFWKAQRDGFTRKSMTGEGYSGTGGLLIPNDNEITLSVRPLQGLVEIGDGKLAKTFAKFEVEVPLVSTFWTPSQIDARLESIPSRLEKNAYDIAKRAKEKNIAQWRANKDGAKSKRTKLFPPKPKRGNSSRGGGNAALRSSPMISASSYSTLSFLSQYDRHSKHNISKLSAFKKGLGMSQILTIENNTVAATSSNRPAPLWSSQLIRMPNWQSSVKLKPENRISHEMARQSRFMTSLPKAKNGRLLAAGILMTVSSWLFNSTSFASAAIDSTTILESKHTYHRHSRPFGDINSNDSHTLFFPEHSSERTKENLPYTGWLCSRLRGGDWIERNAPSSTPPLEFAHGTTTLSFAFRGGIIAAVDSRASLGSFVGSKTVEKVLPINSHMLGTMAGGAADCQHWIRALKAEALFHELTERHDTGYNSGSDSCTNKPVNRRGRRMSIARASRILSDILYSNRGADLSVGTMIMGYDDDPLPDEFDAVPHIYYIDNTGLRISGDLFAVGSGATFALGILDTATTQDYRMEKMTVEEAIALGIKAIRHATFRDAFSGGYINVYLITPQNGWQRVYQQDIARSPDAWQSLKEEENDSA